MTKCLIEGVIYWLNVLPSNNGDAVDRSWCLGILEGYGVGPSARRLLHNYWRRITMAERAGGYYGAAFKGARGVYVCRADEPDIRILSG